MGGRVRHLATAAAIVALAAIAGDHAALGSRETAQARGGIFRVSLNTASGLDFVDPALASSPAAWAVLDTMCARLMSYPDKPPPAEPPWAAGGKHVGPRESAAGGTVTVTTCSRAYAGRS